MVDHNQDKDSDTMKPYTTHSEKVTILEWKRDGYKFRVVGLHSPAYNVVRQLQHVPPRFYEQWVEIQTASGEWYELTAPEEAI